MPPHPGSSGSEPGPPAPQPPAEPRHVHLFQPGHAASARRALQRGWPDSYLAVCVVCSRTLDLLAIPASPTDEPHERA